MLSCISTYGSFDEGAFYISLYRLYECFQLSEAALTERNHNFIPVQSLMYQVINLFCEFSNCSIVVSKHLNRQYLRKEYASEILDINESISKIETLESCIDEIARVLNYIEASQSIVSSPFGLSSIYICGHILPSYLATPWIPNVIMTSSSVTNLNKLSLALLGYRPILLCADIGTGKSFYIKEVAAAIGKLETLIELHLDDQSDAKSLMGSYVCTDVPGEFLWKNGVVTQAAINGYWIILECVDCIPLDIMTTLLTLLESRKFSLPGRDDVIEAHQDFRIFGTSNKMLSESRNSDVARNNSFLEEISLKPESIISSTKEILDLPEFRYFPHVWHMITLDSLSINEVYEVIQLKFQQLIPPVIQSLFRVYDMFSSNSSVSINDSSITSIDPEIIQKMRKFSLRDLEKVCKRITVNISTTFNQVSKVLTEEQTISCFKETVDVFAASVRFKAVYDVAVREIGRCWGLTADRLDIHIFHSQPVIHGLGSVNVQIGRVFYRMHHPLSQYNDNTNTSDVRNQEYAVTPYTARILERLASCVVNNECVLLVGETGVGKTTSIQELANIFQKKLIVQNLSLSTDASDLLGGYRPVTVKHLLRQVYEEFLLIFHETFSSSQNSEFCSVVSQIFVNEHWKKLIRAFQKGSKNAIRKLTTSSHVNQVKLSKWNTFIDKVNRLELSLPKLEQGYAFSFIDGQLVEALRKGYWVLLDEINLASSETLQSLMGILDGQSYTYTDKGDIETIGRHSDFRIFAGMNPPTDVGKRELPATLRSRFTEIYVEEMLDRQDLKAVVLKYFPEGLTDSQLEDIVSTYLECRKLANAVLVDGNDKRPKYSMRSLTRSLNAAKSFIQYGFRPINRAVFEGFQLNFYTQLGKGNQREQVFKVLKDTLQVRESLQELSLSPARPGGKKSSPSEWVLVKPFWLKCGDRKCVDWALKDESGTSKFVMTKTIEEYLRSLCAGIAADVSPILLEGPTSVGKTT